MPFDIMFIVFVCSLSRERVMAFSVMYVCVIKSNINGIRRLFTWAILPLKLNPVWVFGIVFAFNSPLYMCFSVNLRPKYYIVTHLYFGFSILRMMTLNTRSCHQLLLFLWAINFENPMKLCEMIKDARVEWIIALLLIRKSITDVSKLIAIHTLMMIFSFWLRRIECH